MKLTFSSGKEWTGYNDPGTQTSIKRAMSPQEIQLQKMKSQNQNCVTSGQLEMQMGRHVETR